MAQRPANESDPTPLSLVEHGGRSFLVPPEHRWLSVLYAACLRAGLPVGEAVLADGVLRVALGAGPRPLTALVVPRDADVRGWRSTARHVLTYEGGGGGDARVEGEAHLKRLLALIVRLDALVPARFEGFAALGVDTTDPERALTRLFPFVTVERSWQGPVEVVEVLVRTTTLCNERCPFCSGPKHHTPSFEMVRACLRAADRDLPGAMISLTGGEPTLKKSFFDELDEALALPGLTRVQVQTNAVSFAERIDPRRWDLGRGLSFFVSMHGVTDDVYDACTGTQGLLPEALRGLERILAAGHPVTVNTVANRLNVHQLDGIVRKVAELDAPVLPRIHFSVLICPEHRPGAADYLVRYTELVPALLRAADAACEAGLSADSLLASTHASAPACCVPVEERGLGSQLTRESTPIASRAGSVSGWVKAPTCARCVATGSCLGVPAPYAKRFGLDELVPIALQAR